MQHRENFDAGIWPETMFCSNLTSRAIGRSSDIYVLGEHRHLILHIDSNVQIRRRSLYPELEAMTCTNSLSRRASPVSQCDALRVTI